VGSTVSFAFLLGLYVLQHFLTLFPWARRYFPIAGFARCSGEPAYRLFPMCLRSGTNRIPDNSAHIRRTLVGLLTVGFGTGQHALVLWYFVACLLGRNPNFQPRTPFIGWLLLLHAVLPKHLMELGSSQPGRPS